MALKRIGPATVNMASVAAWGGGGGEPSEEGLCDWIGAAFGTHRTKDGKNKGKLSVKFTLRYGALGSGMQDFEKAQYLPMDVDDSAELGKWKQLLLASSLVRETIYDASGDEVPWTFVGFDDETKCVYIALLDQDGGEGEPIEVGADTFSGHLYFWPGVEETKVVKDAYGNSKTQTRKGFGEIKLLDEEQVVKIQNGSWKPSHPSGSKAATAQAAAAGAGTDEVNDAATEDGVEPDGDISDDVSDDVAEEQVTEPVKPPPAVVKPAVVAKPAATPPVAAKPAAAPPRPAGPPRPPAPPPGPAGKPPNRK